MIERSKYERVVAAKIYFKFYSEEYRRIQMIDSVQISLIVPTNLQLISSVSYRTSAYFLQPLNEVADTATRDRKIQAASRWFFFSVLRLRTERYEEAWRRRETFPSNMNSERIGVELSRIALRFPTSRQYGHLPAVILRLFAHSTAMFPPPTLCSSALENRVAQMCPKKWRQLELHSIFPRRSGPFCRKFCREFRQRV